MTTEEMLNLEIGDCVSTIYGDVFEVLMVTHDYAILSGNNPMRDCCPEYRNFEIECKVEKEKKCNGLF